MAPRITPRQREQIHSLLQQGLTQPAIALRVGVSERSVRRERAELVQAAKGLRAPKRSQRDVGDAAVPNEPFDANRNVQAQVVTPASVTEPSGVVIDEPTNGKTSRSEIIAPPAVLEARLAEARAEGARAVVPVAEVFVANTKIEAEQSRRAFESEIQARDEYAGRLERKLADTRNALVATNQQRIEFAAELVRERDAHVLADERGDYFLQQAAETAVELDDVYVQLEAAQQQPELLSRILLGVRGMFGDTNDWDAASLALEWSKVTAQNLPALRLSVEVEVQRQLSPLLVATRDLAAAIEVAPLTDMEATARFSSELASLQDAARVRYLAVEQIVSGVVGIFDIWAGVQGPATELASCLASADAAVDKRLEAEIAHRAAEEQAAARDQLMREGQATLEVLTALHSAVLSSDTSRELRARVDGFVRRQQADLSHRMFVVIETRYRTLESGLDRCEQRLTLGSVPLDELTALERGLAEWDAVLRYRPVDWAPRLEGCRERVAALSVRYEHEETARQAKQKLDAETAREAEAQRDARWAKMSQRPTAEQIQFVVSEVAPSLLRLGLGLLLDA